MGVRGQRDGREARRRRGRRLVGRSRTWQDQPGDYCFMAWTPKGQIVADCTSSASRSGDTAGGPLTTASSPIKAARPTGRRTVPSYTWCGSLRNRLLPGLSRGYRIAIVHFRLQRNGQAHQPGAIRCVGLRGDVSRPAFSGRSRHDDRNPAPGRLRLRSGQRGVSDPTFHRSASNGECCRTYFERRKYAGCGQGCRSIAPGLSAH